MNIDNDKKVAKKFVDLGNGSIILNDKKYAISWNGMYAEHVAVNFANKKPQHDILHIEIQQALQKAKTFVKNGRSTYWTISKTKKGDVFIAFQKYTKFVEVITSYRK
ncbi:MAG: hypothetical protein LBS50_10470 [Prevotellaceae bacterium]|nr:hypothetical protein [Prevotellaceae bacterium]